MGPDYVNLRSVESRGEGLIILMYHSIAVPPLGHSLRGLHVSPHLLRAQLLELKRAGIPFTTLEPWDPASPGRQIALTFDDGFQNNLRAALPILTDLGLTSILYVPAGLIGQTNAWDAPRGAKMCPLMDRAELLEWSRAGQQIGAHGLTHRDLTRIPLAEARREIFESKAVLEDLLQKEVAQFCYPYGSYNAAVRDLVQEAGYRLATATTVAINGPESDRFALHRLMASHRRPILAAWTGGLLG